MTENTSTLKKLKDALAAKTAKEAPLKNGSEKRTIKSIREQRYETNDATVTPQMHDPEVAPHLFKKWVGDRVAMVRVRHCDNPNCTQRGEFRAPKSRYNMDDYYWFCLDHVRIYNASWDYYQGMSVAEIEDALRAGTTWERPTWPMGDRKIEKKIRAAFKRAFDEDDIESNAEHIHAKAQERGVDPRYAAQLNALRELGLAPPIDFEGIKKRYRDLVKAHHPDVLRNTDNGDDNGEKIKRLNSAFTILKEFYAFEEVNMANAGE